MLPSVLVNKMLIFEIFMKNWTRNFVQVISDQIKIFSNFRLTTILFSEKISILVDMRCTLRLDQFFMKILFFNNLLTKGQQLLTKFDLKAPRSIFSKRCIENSWTKLIMLSSTQNVKSYCTPILKNTFEAFRVY